MKAENPWRALFLIGATCMLLRAPHPAAQAPTLPGFSVDEILSLPQPDNLVASPVGSTVAWTFNERGARNVYVADAPAFAPRRLTATTEDDGQELSHVSFSNDGRWLVYVRGGDHGSNPNVDPPNPASETAQPTVQVWAVPVAGGTPRLVAEGDDPQIAPDSRRVAFVRNRRIWVAAVDGSQKPEAAFFARGSVESPAWSPDGRTLAFVVNRGDHSFIGLFTPGQPVRYVGPSTSRDSMPIWSPDSTKIAFLREPGAGGTPRPPLSEREAPWTIMVAATTDTGGRGEVSATALWTSWQPVDRILRDPSGISLRWGAANRLVFLSYRDHFAHVYSMAATAGNQPLLLTPGSFMVEQFAVTPDGRQIVYTANTGSDPADFDRRHLFVTPVDRATPTALTRGMGIEWSPAITAEGRTVAFISAEARRPPLPAIVTLSGGPPSSAGRDASAEDLSGRCARRS